LCVIGDFNKSHFGGVKWEKAKVELLIQIIERGNHEPEIQQFFPGFWKGKEDWRWVEEYC